ncbi:glyoxylase I family protein [Actinosynnema pretiosum]|nr:glyoxylase I family protein [Actinosynnema pretiosum]
MIHDQATAPNIVLMPQPQGAELAALSARRDALRERYLHRSAAGSGTPVRGVHHIALICRDVEQTIRFYQEFLGFPLVELVENRDYNGSSHFFFDLGNRNLLGFFDFPGHAHPEHRETIGAVQHLALSVDGAAFEELKRRLDAAGVEYLGPARGSADSMYIRDPNGIGLEFYRQELGRFEGRPLLGDARRALGEETA